MVELSSLNACSVKNGGIKRMEKVEKKELEKNADLSIQELVRIYKTDGKRAKELLKELKALKSKESD